MFTHFRHVAIAVLLILTAAMAVPVEAGSIYFKENGLGVSGLELQAPFYFRSFAGQLIVDGGLPGTGDDMAVFCVDLNRPKASTQEVTIRPLSELGTGGNPTGIQADAGARIAWLLNQYATSAWLATDGDNRAAALQLAIWEILYDPYGGYDLGAGNFRLLYLSSHAGIASYASGYFTALGSNRSEALWFDTNTGQDFAAPQSVPEGGPGTVLLFGSCAAGLLSLARRRTNP